MKRIFAVFALAAVAHAQQLLAPAPSTITVTVHLCKPYADTDECRVRLADWTRLKDEADLSAAIVEDFRDVQTQRVSPGTRQRIMAIAKRLAKNAYF